MYELFSKNIVLQGASLTPAGYENMRGICLRNLEAVVHRYRDRVTKVSETHTLVRLLNTFSIPYNDFKRFEDVALLRSPYVAKFYNFTSSINYGTWHSGEFYGKGRELYIYDDAYDASQLHTWEDIRAVEVLEHQISDTALLVPDGRVKSTGRGLVVMKINIPMLLLQYKGWEISRRKHYPDGPYLGAAHFVSMYVLPNILYSHLDLVIINRLINIATHAPMSSALMKHTFPLIPVDGRLDAVLRVTLNNIKSKAQSYQWYLSNIKTITAPSAYEALKMPKTALTRQVSWAMYFTRMRVVNWLMDVGGRKGGRYNKASVNKWTTSVSRVMRDGVFKERLSPGDVMDIKYKLDEWSKL
jgi:hypothetical protein